MEKGFKDSRVQGFQSPEKILDSKPSPTHDENRTNSGHGHVIFLTEVSLDPLNPVAPV